MSIAYTSSMPVRTGRAIEPQNAAPSDEALIERISAGDQAALRTLADRHYRHIYRFVMRFVRDHEIAEDVVNDTLFAAWKQASRFESRSSVATWLMAIARYKALTARSRQRIPTEPLDDDPELYVDPADRPDELAVREDVSRDLRRCVKALPVEQGLLIDLVYYREKSVKEAAAIAGIPVNTAKTRLFLGRRKLAAMLAAGDHGSLPNPEQRPV
jgi:RNA polymerase sigma-70 factor (ECF subfamily)